MHLVPEEHTFTGAKIERDFDLRITMMMSTIKTITTKIKIK
jgi:hypothetical protein